MTKFFIIIISSFLLIFPSSSTFSQDKIPTTDKLNILMIAVDDLKPLINAYGQDQMHTPNFDRLAKMGVSFTNAHVQQAVCGPSRASVMTATYPDRNKVWDLHTDFRDSAPDLISMPEHLIQQGYRSEAIGKIYHYNAASPNHDGKSWTAEHFVIPDDYEPVYGMPPFAYWMDPALSPLRDSLYEETKKHNLIDPKTLADQALKKLKPTTEGIDLPDEAYPDGLFANEAIKRLQKFSKQQSPFFLALGFVKPHLPFNAPKKYWDLYQRNEIDLAAFRALTDNVPEFAYHTLWEIGSYSDIDGSLPLGEELPEAKQRELIHGYMACVSYIDAQLGKILDELERLALDKNTLIALWGDHGYHLGDHSQWCKHSNFEQATRIPFIFAGPGLEKDKKVNTPVELIDLFPTLFDLASIPQPAQSQGNSLKSLMDNNLKAEIGQDYAVSQFHRGNNRMGYSIRTQDHRYTEWFKYANTFKKDGTKAYEKVIAKELYDYSTDPYESVNFAGHENYVEIEKMLKNKLADHLITYGSNPQKQKKKKVFLMGGQSNMAGRANGAFLSGEEKARLKKAGEQIVFHYNHEQGKGLALTNPADYIKKKFKLEQSFGPEIFFGIELARHHPENDFLFIKRAIGGTSLYGCWNPYWDEKKAAHMNELKRPKLFIDLMSYTQEILTQYDSSEYSIEAMLWVQGETDSGRKKWGTQPSEEYEQNLKNLIYELRKQLKQPDLPFMMLQVGSGKVVEAMKNIAREDRNTYLIPQSLNQDSKDYYPRNPPPVGHYTYEGMKKIGLEFYKLYSGIIKE